jgi:hypothetical protein
MTEWDFTRPKKEEEADDKGEDTKNKENNKTKTK